MATYFMYSRSQNLTKNIFKHEHPRQKLFELNILNISGGHTDKTKIQRELSNQLRFRKKHLGTAHPVSSLLLLLLFTM